MSKTPITTLPTDENIREWLTEQLKDNKLTYLLAFADDGVIWGRMADDGSLVIAHETSQKEDRKNYTQLRGKTLQQAYAFSDKMEVRLFHDEMGGWKALKIEDEGEVITESQILWGDKLAQTDQPINVNFSRLLAERKGIPPQIVPVDRKEFVAGKCVRLEVHHLVKYNEDGEAYIELSRLAGLDVKDKNLEVAK